MNDLTTRRISCLITARYGTFTGTPAAGLATYDIIGHFDVLNGVPFSLRLLNQTPVRTAVGCDMIPASVRHPCDVIMVAGETYLFCPTEQIPVDEAC